MSGDPRFPYKKNNNNEKKTDKNVNLGQIKGTFSICFYTAKTCRYVSTFPYETKKIVEESNVSANAKVEVESIVPVVITSMHACPPLPMLAQVVLAEMLV